MRAAVAIMLLLLAGAAAAEDPPLPTADYVLVDKSDRTLTLFAEGPALSHDQGPAIR
jgi:hypothetical protein